MASLTGSLAWPLSIVVVALVFRQPLSHLVRERLETVEAFGARATFGRLLSEQAATVEAAIGEPIEAVDPPSEAKQSEAEANPVGLVMTAAGQLERALAELLADQPIAADKAGLRQLSRLAFDNGLISKANFTAIDGLAVLRNLAAHGQGGQITAEEALAYVSFVDAVLYSLRTKPR